jgi:hypothetical protein
MKTRTIQAPVVAYMVAVGLMLMVAQPVAQERAERELYASDTMVLDINPDSLHRPTASYVGAAVCGECHADAWEIWLGTGHARSWVFLRTAAADSIAARIAGGPVSEPAQSQRCLRCHATAAGVAPADRVSLALQDGVQCEGCHGPGSMHIEQGLVLAGDRLEASRMEIPDEQGCRVCHTADRPAHEGLGRPAFDYPQRQTQIAHPSSREARWNLFRERPGAYLSIGLRTVLSRLFGS